MIKSLVRLFSLRGAIAISLLACAATAGSDPQYGDNSGINKPAFLRALPEHMFRCLEDAQCAVVQGWCATFAINRADLATYDQIPPDPNGKGARGCPPGWVPPLPRAVCEAKLCKVVSSRPEQAP